MPDSRKSISGAAAELVLTNKREIASGNKGDR